MEKSLKLFLASLTLAPMLSASTSVINSAKSDLSLTIYNNLAMVDETRAFEAKQGKSLIVFKDVPENIIQDSVFPNFITNKKNANIKLYSQNYSFNTVSFNNMIKYFKGKKIGFKDAAAVNGVHEGTLISINPIMIDTGKKGIQIVSEKNRIIFPSIPKHLNINPSLFWRVHSSDDIKGNIELKYLTKGFFWQGNYVIDIINDKTCNLNGFINVENNSGVDYKNAKIAFLAGNLNLIPNAKPYFYNDNLMHKDSKALNSSSLELSEENFNSYHLFKIPFKISLRNNEKQQISFVKAKNIKYQSLLKADLNPDYLFKYRKNELDFYSYLEFDNTQSNNLGYIFPKGVVNIYGLDSKGFSHFIGQDKIQNTPKNEKISFKTGEDFDVKGKIRFDSYINNNNLYKLSAKISLQNHKDKDAQIELDLNTNQNFKPNEISSSNCNDKSKICNFKDGKYKIKLKANSNFTTILNINANK